MSFANVQKVPAAPYAHGIEDATSPALAQALNCLRVAITLYDSQQRLIYANQHFDYLFRAMPPRARLLGLTYDELVRLEVTGGELAAQAYAGGIDAFAAKRCAQLSEGDFAPFDLAMADGRIVEIKSRRTRDGGWIVLWSDATQARHATDRLESAIALSADAFAFFDRRDRLVVCNADFATLFGHAAEAMRGLDFASILVEAAASNHIAIEGDRDAWIASSLAQHRAPAGAMVLQTCAGQAFLVRDRQTQGGRVVVLTDITDERRAEAALAEQSSALDSTRAALADSRTYLADLTQRLDAASTEADTTKKTLLRTMSHELKTPLNAIIGFSDLLLQMGERLRPEQVKEYASLIHAGGHNLLRMLNHILDLTKLAAGKFELCRSRIDAGGALWIARDQFGERAAAKSIAIDADTCPVGLIVEADENAFGQMVQQLLENAIAFTPNGGAIVLSAAAKDGRVRLTVADNGPGVASADLDRILQPFEQAGRGTTDHAHGAGLGLTLVKAFAELHGGSLTLASEAGKGFAATIELPAASI